MNFVPGTPGKLTQGPAAMSGLSNHWMPFTANRSFKQSPRLFSSAAGVYFWDADGRPVLDGSSALFTTALGHCREEIASAVHSQLQRLDFTSSFMRGHSLSSDLAERLSAILPRDLDRLFFVNSGSEAVDTAMKISVAYHAVTGSPGRSVFVSRERAYHGTNLGGVSLSGMQKNRSVFGSLACKVVHMRHTWLPESRFTMGQPEAGAGLADDLLRLIQLHGAENIAACIVEPIAGSTGVLVPPIGYLQRLRSICDEHGILLVFDEVICGFGRTGHPFAAHAFEVVPDVITLAKAITNGAIPMGAVAVSRKIYEAIVEHSREAGVEFFHGYTASAHPVACAAALATLDIFENEKIFSRAAELAPAFLDSIMTLAEHPCVSDVRGFGLLAGVELLPSGSAGTVGNKLQERLFDLGLHVKTTGDTAILAPPLIATAEHVREMTRIMRTALSELSVGL